MSVHPNTTNLAHEEYSEEEYKKLKRKTDKYLLPLMWLCYGIQQTDKTSIGTQATFGLQEVRSYNAGFDIVDEQQLTRSLRILDLSVSNVSFPILDTFPFTY